VALIRGINVGGKNLIKMPDLRRVFEGLGHKNVATYIASGNVLFESKLKNPVKVAAAIEGALEAEFRGIFPVVALQQAQMEIVMKKAPPGFGEDQDRYRYDVVFLRPPFRADTVLPTISLREGVDECFERNGVLYFRRLVARASQSRLSKITQHEAYRSMTIRNWNTTKELCRLICLDGDH
jgi:uncharacterized protein (DUF1697 family)